MLVTNNDKWGERAKYLSTQTKTILDNGAFYHKEIGYNFRMPNLLAAVGVAQLEMVPEYLKAKIRNAKLYNELLKDVKGITLIKNDDNEVSNCYWLYSVLVEDDFPVSRDELISILKENEIGARPFFMPVHEMPPYMEYKHGDMAITKEVSSKGVNLPSSVSLSEEEVKKVCEVIKNIK